MDRWNKENNSRHNSKSNANIRRVISDDEFLEEEEYAKSKRRIQKKKRQKRNRLKALVFFLFAVGAVTVILFLTPLFNIKNVNISGNSIVSNEQIEAQTGSVIGENLFKISSGGIRKSICEIPFVNDANVTKKLIPPEINIEIDECLPAGYISVGGKNVVVNEELKVVDNNSSIDMHSIPQILGVEVKTDTPGKQLKLTDDEKEEALKVFVKTFTKIGQTANIVYIDLTDIANLKFSYLDRIEVSCGSALELSGKLRMFKETVTSTELDANARGTIDLSIPGKAIYAP